MPECAASLRIIIDGAIALFAVMLLFYLHGARASDRCEKTRRAIVAFLFSIAASAALLGWHFRAVCDAPSSCWAGVPYDLNCSQGYPDFYHGVAIVSGVIAAVILLGEFAWTMTAGSRP